MGDSIKFLSIDEQAVFNKSVNLEEAASNLKKLQEHIFYPQSSKNYSESTVSYPKPPTECPKSTHFSRNDPKTFSDYPKTSTDDPGRLKSSKEYSGSSKTFSQNLSAYPNTAYQPKSSVAMAAGKEVALKSGKAIFYERQPSVNDEDLFGEGKMPQEHQSNTDLGTNSSIISEENPGAAKVGYMKSERDEDKSVVNEVVGIPNFGMLGMSSSSKSDSSISPKPFEVIEPSTSLRDKYYDAHNNTEEKNVVFEHIQEPDSDFKMRFQGKRSISADDRRKKYSSGGEVFDHTIDSVEEEYQVGVQFIKSNSLPDLVTCSNQSPVSPPRYYSNPQSDVRENLEKQFELKKVVEGPSKNTPVSKEIRKVKRSVSIKEKPDYIPVKSDDDNEDVNTPCEKPVTSSEERRRILSSGYVTGSSEAGSQEKTDVETSRQISQISQGSSGVWTSQDSIEKTETQTNASNKKGIDTEVGLPPVDTALLQSTHSTGGNERQNVSLQSSGSGCNESGSTDSSVITIIDARHEDARKKSNEEPNKISKFQVEVSVKRSQDIGSYELPNLSVMNMSNKSHELSSSFGRLRVEEEKGVKSVGSNRKGSEDLKQEQAVELKSPESFEPPSYGNLPNILLDSFSLKGSSLAKVQEEEDQNRKAVETTYCREGGDGSPGYGHPGLGQVEPAGAFGMSSPGSSCNQPSPPEAVKRLEEYLLRLKNYDLLSPNALEKLNQTVRGPDSLTSPYSHDKERSDTPGAQGFKDLTLDELEKASRCNFPQCKETCCLKMQEIYRILKEEIPHLDPMYRLVTSYYKTLCQHSENGCEETKCPVLFCSEILEWDTYASNDPVKNLVRNIQQYFNNPTLKVFLPTSGKFHKLQSRMPKLEVKEFETHTPMFTLGKFGTAKVCFESQCQKLVVLKMYPLMECDHQLSLYTRLKDLDHPNIVTQLWMLEYDDKIQVCSLFAQGGSLEDYLNAVGPLPWSKVVRYMKQILSAICQLHERGVVYLNWNSGNMLFPDDRRYTVQVGNFSLSCPVGCQWDIGSVKECLPYNICPPELFGSNYKLNFKSDAWGAGCLLYEMLTGSPFLHHLRHEDRRTVHRQIQNELSTNLPDLSSFSKEKRVILDSCWQIRLEDRKEMVNILHDVESLRVR